MKPNRDIRGHHHLTLNVGVAQEDYDFHTKVLGLKSIKKTALYDGDEPILHLYYGNANGDPGTLITCFPMRQSGRKARRGTGQIGAVALSVSEGSLGFWKARLRDHGFDVRDGERFGEKLLRFAHPCGIPYEIVGVARDRRAPYSNGAVPAEHGIRGTHGITVSVRDVEASEEFMHYGWNGQNRRTDGRHVRYEIGEGGSGTIVDFLLEPEVPQGSWAYGEGVPHHCAFEVDTLDVQKHTKSHLEGLGYTDVSDVKDRGYFDSVYVRTPGGALFEATVSKPKGFLVDEPFEKLGTELQIPPVFAHRRDELVRYLERVRD
ncbi:MAG TPA: hydroxyquinol 1,2-dioxygenase [Polyangiaceae bacterium]|nr:hydroxyquinol 1,2-dioxygenase [Polyangiaceae bacterium]